MIKLKDYLGCLSQQAFKVENSRGRKHPQDEDAEFNSINPFVSDAGKILESKAIRRLADKTQVYYYSHHAHVRTRLTHTLEVTSLAVRLAVITGLNKELTQAIALGHDTGHTPAGHTGEEFISQLLGIKFRHEKFGPILLHHIERKGQGINLTWEVYQGILNHSRTYSDLKIDLSLPAEYALVLLADKLDYTFADVNDLVRYRNFDPRNLPPEVEALGHNQRARILNCVKAIIKESAEQGHISFSHSPEAEKFKIVCHWLYEHSYKKERYPLYQAALKNAYDFLHSKYQDDTLAAIALAVMTDREVNSLVEIRLTSGVINDQAIKNFSFMEIMPYILNKKINLEEFIW